MYDNYETCIDVKMNVVFTLSDGEEVVRFDGNNFTVKSGDCATVGEYQAVLTLTNSNEDLLALTFNALPYLSVNMSLMFTFAPVKFFPGIPIPNTISLLDTGDLKLGFDTQLYRCDSSQRMTLTGDLEGTTYTMNMDMSNVQIQAFNIKNGKLSTDVFVCSADQMTSVAQETTKATSEPTQPTTEPYDITTVGPSDVTTVGSSNATTEKTTVPSGGPTTLPPNPSFPPKSRYEVKENSKVCLILEGRFQLKVTYITKENKTATTTVDVPVSSDVTVTGTCASGNENLSGLTITPKDGEIQSLIFNFEIMNGKSNLMSWFANVNISDAIEPDFNHSVTDKVNLSSPKLYYKCEKEGNFSDSTLAFMYMELKMQAFNVEDGRFSENGVYCEADFGPIPAPGYSPVNIYSVLNGNKTCVLFKGSIQFYIPYISKTGITTEVVSLPAVYNVSGECNTTLNGLFSQQMVIRFYDAWILTIYFSTDKNQKTDLLSAGTPVDNYYISQIELKYDYNNILFTDAVDSILGKEMSVVADNLRKLTTNNDKSYKCLKETTFHLQNGLSMVTKDLQYQSFKTGDTADFSAAVNCDSEEDKHYILYIAIGAAGLGCLLIVVLVVTVYVINKRRKYEQLTL
ncbi:lysosome-associated membrane glycoprotein 1-like [Saccostrea cucullata]|uniref:lysosome-associated membrane glycoprotein 1-like n=1 Tax=Saccostrea cuccullata TaxID=36930 RepID=UPI002ED13BEA